MASDRNDLAAGVAEWDSSHERWSDLQRLIDELHQSEWVSFHAPWHRSSHILVATSARTIAGFLRFVVQEIGPDADHAIVTLGGEPLLEAKVLAFGVLPSEQRRGFGRFLQDAAIQRASKLDCYQMRSHSGGSNLANHQLKLSMGFGVHPIIRGDDSAGVYFVLSLRGPTYPDV